MRRLADLKLNALREFGYGAGLRSLSASVLVSTVMSCFIRKIRN